MKFLILIGLSTNVFAVELKTMSESLHSDRMAVDYKVFETGKQVLVTREIISVRGASAPEFKEHQVTDLKMKDNELMASHNGFKCSSKDKKFVYAVIDKSKVKEKGFFKPERAWTVNEKKFTLDPVAKLSSVKCEWSPEADAKYPF